MGARRFLPPNHRYRSRRYDKYWGNKPETRSAPIRPTGQFWLSQWERVQRGDIPSNESGINFLSSFYRLPYFKVHIPMKGSVLSFSYSSIYLFILFIHNWLFFHIFVRKNYLNILNLVLLFSFFFLNSLLQICPQ